MQFQVPQFIEVEDKIFGPLTFKQFIYVGGAVGASYMLYRLLPIYMAGPLIALVAGLGAALAFLQLNGRPFIISLESGFFYILHSKLYLWNNERRLKNRKEKEKVAARAATVYIPKLSESRLHELAWSLDIKERIAAGINPNEAQIRPEREDTLAVVHTAREARAPARVPAARPVPSF
jgi:hypothetical protein